MGSSLEREELVRKTGEAFWKTIPPLWHYTRGAAHRIAREEHGITFSQFYVLRRIWRGKRSVSELSERMHVSKPNISRAVEELVNAGLAQRTRDPDDRRVQYLTLTEKGQALLESLHERNHNFMRELFANLEGEELETLTTAFEKIGKFLSESEHTHK